MITMNPSARLVAALIGVYLSFHPFCSALADEYGGSVGKWGAAYSLHWKDDGTVEGTYHYPGKRETVYTLKGKTNAEGELYLEEYTADKLTARCYLTKALAETMIVWKGEMHNTDGQQFVMTMETARTGEATEVIEKSASISPIPQEPEKGKFETVSNFFLFAQSVAAAEGCKTHQVVVESITEAGANTLVVFRPRADEPSKPSSFTLQWENRLGPAPFARNVDALVEATEQGEVISATVWIVPAKWRKNTDGNLEFLLWGIGDDGEKVVGKSQFTGSPLRVAATPFILRPVRVAEFFAETYFIAVKGVGAVAAVFESGPGMVELESIDLDVKSEDIPWVDMPADGAFPEIPASQYIKSEQG